MKNGPGERRRFLDIAISQIKPKYAIALSKYVKVLAQRNALLRQIAQGAATQEYLHPWDAELARLGAMLFVMRREYIVQLSTACVEVYSGITAGKESLQLYYEAALESSACSEAEAEAQLLALLQEKRQTDIRRLHTTHGVHKEDLLLQVQGMPARAFASQGQQRSCALALKIGEAQLLHESTGEKPIVLLDDVMSELDEQRQQDILRYMENWQVFVTCCEPSRILRLKTGKAFAVSNGEVTVQ